MSKQSGLTRPSNLTLDRSGAGRKGKGYAPTNDPPWSHPIESCNPCVLIIRTGVRHTTRGSGYFALPSTWQTDRTAGLNDNALHTNQKFKKLTYRLHSVLLYSHSNKRCGYGAGGWGRAAVAVASVIPTEEHSRAGRVHSPLRCVHKMREATVPIKRNRSSSYLG